MVLFWCDYGYNIEFGENFFANHNTIILNGDKVKFGDHVFIAPDCVFLLSSSSPYCDFIIVDSQKHLKS